MTPAEFGQHVKQKYPEYHDIDDTELAQKVLAKYPEYNDMVQPEQPGVLKSAGYGAVSGVPGLETALSGIESAVTPKTYEQVHGEWEKGKETGWQAHPVAYGAGKVAGMVGTGLAAPEVLGGGILGAAATGAGIGALSGADVANKPSEMLPEVAKGAITGGVTGGVLGAAGKALEAVPEGAQRVVASMGKNTTLDDIKSYLSNPKAVQEALSRSQLAEQVTGAVTDIGKASGGLSEQARSLLQPGENQITLGKVADVFQAAADKYYRNGEIKTGMQPAVDALEKEFIRIHGMAQQNGGQVDETLLRGVIDDLQKATKDSTFGNPEAGAKQGALKDLSGQLNDILRSSNPAYAEQIAPSSDLVKLSKDAQTHFGLKLNEEGDLAPTDTTSTKIGNVLKEGKPQGEGILDRIKNATGQDLKDMIEKAQTKENFDEPGTGLGMRALLPSLGYAIGRTTGLPLGGIAGAGLGHAAGGAVNGGQVAKGILDMYMSASESYGNTALKPIVDKFGPILVKAAKVGGNQLAATHFVLATSNPEYQTLVDHVQTNGQP
jgi:hypothetical protein